MNIWDKGSEFLLLTKVCGHTIFPEVEICPPDYFHCHFQTSHHLGVIHKVRTLGEGRGGPAKTVLARMREGERSSVSVRTP